MNVRGKHDFVILGSGIVGLAVARELRQREPDASILILEKKSRPGKHASGRNSGVMHSGIYYPTESLKAKPCVAGSNAMAVYCQEHGLPLLRIGKVIVPTQAENDAQIDLLHRRAQVNGARVSLIDERQLKETEPSAHTASGRALHSPDMAIVDPLAILSHLVTGFEEQGVSFAFSALSTNFNPDRGLEVMIDMLSLLNDRFTLDFYHMTAFRGGSGYRDELKKRVDFLELNIRVFFRDPVPTQEIPTVINQYDIGVYPYKPSFMNEELALPNKFFKSVQARAAIAIGPSTEMARLLWEHDLAVVAGDFSTGVMAVSGLGVEDIQRLKANADAAARVFPLMRKPPVSSNRTKAARQ